MPSFLPSHDHFKQLVRIKAYKLLHYIFIIIF